MPLPHFLLMIVAVVLAAGLTLWLSVAAGLPLIVLLLIALSAVLVLHFGHRGHHHHHHHDPHG